MAWIYPLGLIDTDFGDAKTTPSYSPSAFAYGAHISIPSSGTVTMLSARVGSDDGTSVSFKIGLYTSGGSLVAQSTGGPTTLTGFTEWNDSGTISASVSAGTHYVLVSGSTNALAHGYDTSGNGSYATAAYSGAMQSSLTISDQAETGALFGVRLDFTAGSSFVSRGLLLGVG